MLSPKHTHPPTFQKTFVCHNFIVVQFPLNKNTLPYSTVMSSPFSPANIEGRVHSCCRRCEKDKVNNKTHFISKCIVECDMRVLYIPTRRLISVESAWSRIPNRSKDLFLRWTRGPTLVCSNNMSPFSWSNLVTPHENTDHTDTGQIKITDRVQTTIWMEIFITCKRDYWADSMSDQAKGQKLSMRLLLHFKHFSNQASEREIIRWSICLDCCSS